MLNIHEILMKKDLMGLRFRTISENNVKKAEATNCIEIWVPKMKML